MGRVLVIGDIHSNYKGMMQVLERANFTEEDTLISLGDLVDSHTDVDDAFLVVDYIRKLDNLIYVVGNHDMWWLTFLSTGIHPTGFEQGGYETYASYQRHTKELEQKDYDEVMNGHMNFFKKGLMYYIHKNKLFVHGGFDREEKVARLKHNNPTDFYWNRELWEQAQSCKGKDKLRTADKFDEIFIGHTSTIQHKDKNGNRITTPMYSGGVWNIDTGGGAAIGKITVMDVHTKEYWQSDITKDLYYKTYKVD